MVEEDLPAEEQRPVPTEPVPAPPPTAADLPAGPPAPAAPKEPKEAPVRPIELVRGRYGDLQKIWLERREALREQDLPRAKEAERRLLELKRELGIENLDVLAAAEIRAARQALEARAPGDAVARAELAVALAPDLAATHLVLAEARVVRDPSGQLIAALGDLEAAARAVLREPHTRRAFEGDVLVALLTASFAVSVLVVGLLFLRRLRLVLHDFHHLPLFRHATSLQADFLALALLALPVALHLGVASLLVLLALWAAPYFLPAERRLVALALAVVALLPLGAERVASLVAWTGTLADQVYRLEQGEDDGRVAAALEARAERGELPPAALLALGRHYKRRGDLKTALRWYESAGGRTQALVDIGNVRFLMGDIEGAKAAYLSAIDRAGASGEVTTLAAAHYDLSKIFLRSSALDQAQEARRKAALADPVLVERYGSDDDFRANRWLIDVPVPPAEVAALAVDDAPRAVEEALEARLAGPWPAFFWPWFPLAAALVLWPLAFLGRRLRASGACERCGGPTCTRCGPAAGALCGQCVNVFVKKGVVEARDRHRKEMQVVRRGRYRRLLARGLAIASGGGGHLWLGEVGKGALILFALAFLAAVAVFWRGAVPPPYPSGSEEVAKLAVVVPLALAIWVVAVRHLFRSTRH